MALITFKPTSAGRRQMVRVSTPGLHKGAPAGFVDRVAGQVRRPQQPRPHHHPSQGWWPQAALPHHRFQARQGRHCLPRRASGVRSEPHRAHRAGLLRRRRTPLHHRAEGPEGGRSADGRPDAPIKVGNSLPLRNIPVGTTVHCIEMKPGKGAQLARSAGAGAQLIARDQGYATLRLRSGEMRKVPADCRATIGEVGNDEHNLSKMGKAGAQALARHPPDRSRRGDEPGRPSARRR
jgi:large subunit ribosomal protein L2